VAVRRFEDLIAWQLARQLQNEVFAILDTGLPSRDVMYCDQIRESARSATRNTAEGFGRYYPREFARFLRIAAGSLHERRTTCTTDTTVATSPHSNTSASCA
jgi:four helix bundle protein